MAPLELQSDGQPYENPDDIAAQAYQKISPSFGTTIQNMNDLTGPISMLERAAERGEQEGSSLFDSGIREIGEAQAGISFQPQEQSQMLDPETVKKQYGLDTKVPMSEGLASVISKQKQDNENKEASINRYQNAHSWPENFGTGLAAFIMDPLNDASMLIPGIGEDAILGGLARSFIGKGFIGRTLARGLSQGIAGGVSQAPLAASRMALGSEEGSDYGIRDAARDMAFGAAGGAILGAGLGALGEIGGKAIPKASTEAVHGVPEGGPTSPTGEVPKAASEAPRGLQTQSDQILKASATTQHAAISTAMSQFLNDKPINVQPIFDVNDIDRFDNESLTGGSYNTPADLVEHEAQLARDGVIQGVSQADVRQAKEEIYGTQKPKQEIEPQTKPTTEGVPAEHEAELNQLEAQFKETLPEGLSPDEHQDLTDTQTAVQDALANEKGMTQASGCLKEAGV